MDRASQRLLYWGTILFLIGLLTGLANSAFKNPRTGLSAHLEGVMNGVFLVLVGLVWGRFTNWVACVTAAVTGASRMTPIAGNGFAGGPVSELLTSAMLISVGLTMPFGVALSAWGLRLEAK